MKLNNTNLRELYQADIEDKIPLTRKFCPYPKELLLLFRLKKSEEKKTKIVDHITGCYYCSKEFEFVVEALRCEKKMKQIAEELISKRAKNPILKSSMFKFLTSRFKWGYASLIACALLAFSLTVIFVVSTKFENNKYRGLTQNQVKLTKSKKRSLTKSTLTFEWEYVKEADYYVFEIYNETLYPIWTSNKITKNNIFLPSEASLKLEDSKTYYWMVTAFLQNGIKKESSLTEFQFKE